MEANKYRESSSLKKEIEDHMKILPGPSKYEGLRALKKGIGASYKIGFGPQKNDDDNAFKFRAAYDFAIKHFLGGDVDIEKVSALTAAARSRLERVILIWQVDPFELSVNRDLMEDFEKGIREANRPVMEYARIVGKAEAEDLDIEYSNGDKIRDEEQFYTQKVIERLRER